jgi:hypothetical protein
MRRCSQKCSHVVLAWCLLAPALAQATDVTEHFEAGELRGSLSWDNISAVETGVLRFGGSAGIHVLNGIEVGFEQQFIVPPDVAPESRSWGYVRVVPFRDWPINPFLATRVGFYHLPDSQAPALGAGCGAVMFVDNYLAFEASLFSQAVFHLTGATERQTEFDWRMVLFF